MDEQNIQQNQPFKRIIPNVGKVIVNHNVCIGAASCIAIASGVFKLDADKKSEVFNTHGADDETILLAARACPTKAIFVFDKEGNQIFPQT